MSTAHQPTADQPTKKRGGCLKWVLIVVGVLLAAGMCTAIVGGGDDDGGVDSTTTTETTAATAETSEAETNEPEPAEAAESPAETEAAEPEQTPLAERARAELLETMGVDNFWESEVPWARNVADVEEKAGNLWVTLQLSRHDADADMQAANAIQGVNNFLSDATKDEISFIVIADGTGTVIKQKMAQAGLMPPVR